MGTWGPGPFDNDDACDWLDELNAADIEFVREGLSLAVGREYLEAPDAWIVVAAAEVVACLRGRPPEGEMLEELATFVARGDKPDDPLVEAARAGLDRVTTGDSELKQLWEESDSYGEWRDAVADLKRRLA